MYESYWRLNEKPFENGFDQRYYYPSEVHQGALLKLRYGLENRRGALVLAGAAGLGKTLLVQSLKRQMPEELAPLVHLVFPQMPVEQLLSYLADELGAPRQTPGEQTIEQSVRRIERALSENTRRGRHAILAIDEAHLLREAGCMEALRLLLNFELASRPGMTLLLVGQPPLLTALDRMHGLNERVGVKCLLRPLELEETISYISHRVTAAGATHAIFDSTALEAIHQLTGGIPRRINRLCDLALLIGFAEELPQITAAQIESVSNELVTVAPE